MVNSSGSFRRAFFTRPVSTPRSKRGVGFVRKRAYGTRAPALARTQSKANASRAASFPKNAISPMAILGNFRGRYPPMELIAAAGVSYSGTGRDVKMQSLESIPFHRCRGGVSMTLTVAHISPIISVIAGVLILIIPRLLNLIVALFLILNGLIGLGLLRWLHA
jgi:hypothetical protein